MVNCSSVAPGTRRAERPACSKFTAMAVESRKPETTRRAVSPRLTELGDTASITAGSTTVNGWGVTALPLALLTASGPVLAPVGTVTTSVLAVAVVMVPGVPLKLTLFSAGFGTKPEPKIVTLSPALPRVGVKAMTRNCDESPRDTESRFPAGSYE